MDESQRYRRRSRSRRMIVAGAALAVSSALSGPLGGGRVWAQSANYPASAPTWAEAVRQTQATGATSVLVVTSAGVPASRDLYRALASSPAMARFQGQVLVAELSADAEPGQVERLRVGCPAVIAFRRGATGALERAATYPGQPTVDGVIAWLGERRLVAATPVLPSRTQDSSVVQAGWGHHQDVLPSPQVPYDYTPAPAPVREVYVERPVERKVVRRVVSAPREVVVREVAAPREVEVREVMVREVAAPRNVVSRPREVVVREAPAPREVVVREVAAPREVEEVEEVEEAPAPRQVVRSAPRQVVVREAAPEAAELNLIQPGPIDRMLGGIGNRLRRRALPRVNAEIETQRTVRLAPAPQTRVVLAQPTAPREGYYVPQQPTYCPSPQSYGPSPSPQLPH